MTPEIDVTETAEFLRRFADLMSTGQNAANLLRYATLYRVCPCAEGDARGNCRCWTDPFGIAEPGATATA
jgi:hypothetical protein